MNVLLVSECSKNALTETRRILDQFAERRGERTWQTPITQAGLDTLRRMLRKTARKNTAVACHWIRGRDHSELLWVVGDAGRFNARGAAPTNTTTRDVLRRDDEDDWHTGEDIVLLASLAALLHDLGKACVAFQCRLFGKGEPGRNHYRHEWISLRLLQSFVGDDDDETWLTRMQSLDSTTDEAWTKQLMRDGLDNGSNAPFETLPPVAAAVGWLVLTHHRLPVLPASDDKPSYLGAKVKDFRAERLLGLPGIITADWNEIRRDGDPTAIHPYWQFEHPLPVVTEKWRLRAGHLAERLLRRIRHVKFPWLDNPYAMHMARLGLMLADHHYSSLTDPGQRVRGRPEYALYANTVRKTGEPNQPLDEHLLGVEANARAITRSLPGMYRFLPRLARHKGFRKRSTDPRFRWQDKAFDLAVSLRERAAKQGFFGINMASTGYGKTLANGRILYALADPDQGARFSIALGLRTLTLQTGRVYRELMDLGDDELAIRVGGRANRLLFEHFEEQAEQHGSASAQKLLEEDGHVYFEGDFTNHPILRRIQHEPAIRALIAAPVLVCTVDHLVPATESLRGGRQIAPMLRLMSSDLVLDEIDDFDIDDLPALTRLVHWAGMLGTRVLLSSATLPPALVDGLFRAYRDGRDLFQHNRGEPGRTVDIICAWFDERDTQYSDCSDADSFVVSHEAFSAKRHERLAKAEIRRRAELVALTMPQGAGREGLRAQFAEQLRGHALELHNRHHSIDPHTGKRVSFGLIRMANIEPLVEVAQALFSNGAPPAHRIHLCVYHSQHPLLTRSNIERSLDQALNRKDENAVFDLPEIRKQLDRSPEPDHLFIVLGSPVTEVGRDHDYDWAVVEPSSMRSLIQLAGRVRRHRAAACDMPNIILLGVNLKNLEQPGKPAFCRPGFETEGEWRLNSHDLHDLLEPEEYLVVDSRPRIVQRAHLRPNDSLVDLEHARLRQTLISPATASDRVPRSRRERRAVKTPTVPRLSAATWYQVPRATLTGVLPQQQPFRDPTGPRDVDLVLMPDEAGEGWTLQMIWTEPGRRGPSIYVDVEGSKLKRLDLSARLGERINTWGTMDYMDSLITLAEEMDMALESCAKIFGIVTVPDRQNGWYYHDALGFTPQN